MTEDSRSLADKAYDTIISTGQEINRVKGRPSGRIEPEESAAVLIARSNLAIALAVLAHADAVRQSAPVAAAPSRVTGRKIHRTTMPVGTGRPTGDPVPLEAEPEEAGTRYYLKDGMLSSEAPQRFEGAIPGFPGLMDRSLDED